MHDAVPTANATTAAPPRRQRSDGVTAVLRKAEPVRWLRLCRFASVSLLMLSGCQSMMTFPPMSWPPLPWSTMPETSAAVQHEVDEIFDPSVPDADMRNHQLEIADPFGTENDLSYFTPTSAPRRLRHPTDDVVRDIELEEVLHLSLANNPLVRRSNEFLSGASSILANSDRTGTVSIYDPAIQATDVLFGSRGVEAALADFDAQFTTSLFYGESENIQNTANLNLNQGQVLHQETGTFISRLEKQFAHGGSFAVQHQWNYSESNINRLFPSAYDGFLRAEFRQPLLAGSGIDFTRVAGPIGQNFQTVVGLNQGVVIARINEDISLADFELSVRDLMKETEDLYWDLYLAYRRYDAEVTARVSALRNLKRVEAFAGRLAGGSVSVLALARENYFDAEERTENALADLYALENRLRRLIGLPVNDGAILRPSSNLVSAAFDPDWELCLAEALTNRTELRRQKWNVKSLDYQLRAAKNLTRPRLDLVGQSQVNGFGDELFGGNVPGATTPDGQFRGAYDTLSDANQTSWQVGFELSMPLGFRTAHTQVRNLELRLAKAKAQLAAQELEISHELGSAFQDLDRFYSTAQTAYNRREAAVKRAEAAEIERRIQTLSPEGVDLLLRANIAVREAEISYFSNLVEYTKSISGVHYRKGTLLKFNHVNLAENRWEPKAYQDAFLRALARSKGLHRRHADQLPPPFAAPETSEDLVPLRPIYTQNEPFEDWTRPNRERENNSTPDRETPSDSGPNLRLIDHRSNAAPAAPFDSNAWSSPMAPAPVPNDANFEMPVRLDPAGEAFLAPVPGS